MSSISSSNFPSILESRFITRDLSSSTRVRNYRGVGICIDLVDNFKSCHQPEAYRHNDGETDARRFHGLLEYWERSESNNE